MTAQDVDSDGGEPIKTRPPTLRFSKMHGAGNDFVLLDLRTSEDPSPQLCRALADRRTGVGCDLILGVRGPRGARAVASFAIWTADGSSSPQCGNGARCVSAWLLRSGLARGPRFTVEGPSGTHSVDARDSEAIRTTMGVPRFTSARTPLSGPCGEDGPHEADLGGGGPVRFAVVSMGSPHAVIEVDDVDTAPVGRVGPALRHAGILPPTVNVGFVELVSRDRLRLRVHEYGAGETRACGSGACAAAAVLMRKGRVDRRLTVELPGGELHVSWPGADEEISVAGPAAFVYEGQFFHGHL
ncbi:diaminopimelate epimerase [Nocardiopsis tropica]|uniref:Diaminopimelate epimerase n=1 Tax=Nocardiopsis tropica TaxID=109330 RepID=A0ABU7KSK8_9ACTN|nr:diaminopimelate epimerase [Nocardiopsis umidischolae]MEE2052279.1 diaminopimelate epimerase [Nocardiopsis umidischolae]